MTIIKKLLQRAHTISFCKLSPKIKEYLLSCSSSASIKLKLLILFMFFFSTLCAADANTTDNTAISKPGKIRKSLKKEELTRQEKEHQADLKAQKARNYFLEGNYQQARDLYFDTLDLLKECGPSSPAISKKVESIKETIALIYTSWAKDIIKDAESKADAGKINDAIALCDKAVEIDPSLKMHINKLKKQLERLKQSIVYNKETSSKTLNPNKESESYKLNVLYEQGKLYFKNGELDKARNKFEEILLTDPYNYKAIRNLKQVNQKIYKAGAFRREVTTMERMTEAEWESLSPITTKTPTGERVDISAKDPIKIVNKLSKIQEKLKKIIIPHIEFENVSIFTVMKFLNRESKRLDPTGKGVNIFFRINTSSEDTSETAVDPWDDEFTDEDSWGDESDTEPETINPTKEKIGRFLIVIAADNIPLGQAIDYICKGAGLNYRVRKYAVEIATQDILFEELETRVFPIERESFEALESRAEKKTGQSTIKVKGYFEARGINFPKGSNVVYDPRICRLIATNTPVELEKISEIISELNVIDPQIVISAKFVEMQQSDFDELGFQWQLQRPTLEEPSAQGRTLTWDNNSTQLNRFLGVPTNTSGSSAYRADRALGISLISKDVSLDFIIHTLKQNSKVDILSAPQVTTMNGQKATIRMITDKYYPTSWSEAEYTEMAGVTIFTPSVPEFGSPTPEGIILTVTPTVDADRKTIHLDMLPQVQSFADWTDYSYTIHDATNNQDIPNTVKMPIIQIRTIQTNLRVEDGETVVMGGVIKDTSTDIDDRIPILGDVPLVGRFFRSKIDENDKTNLLIFTTVRLINPDGSPVNPQTNRGKPTTKR